jgi:acyl-CoA thioesterase FadM
MLIWLRLVMVLIRGYFRGQADLLAPHTSTFRAYPLWDCETKTLNAARFISFCELTIMEANVRNGFVRTFFRNGLVGFAGNMAVHYIRPVYAFRKVHVTTTIVGWDDKFFYRRVQFHQNNHLKCECLVRLRVMSWGGKRHDPSEVIELMGQGKVASPPLPHEITLLNYRADRPAV